MWFITFLYVLVTDVNELMIHLKESCSWREEERSSCLRYTQISAWKKEFKDHFYFPNKSWHQLASLHLADLKMATSGSTYVCIWHKNQISNIFLHNHTLATGSPQGHIPSPLLYTLYTLTVIQPTQQTPSSNMPMIPPRRSHLRRGWDGIQDWGRESVLLVLSKQPDSESP